MSNVMTALPNIGDALCSTPQSLADVHFWSACLQENARLTQSEFCTWQNSVRGNSPQNVPIVYQLRRRPNIVQSLVGLR